MSPRFRPYLATAAAVLVTVLVLRWYGRLWWCACGSPAIWIGDARGPHTSQHLFDPYSISHLTHGIYFFGLAWLIGRRWQFGWKFAFAVVLECGWELLENSNAVISRFRTQTAAVGYSGDTIANSLGDIVSAAVGVCVARRVGLWWSIGIIVAIEIILALWIRDNLFLDALMLIHPSDAIRAWQTGR